MAITCISIIDVNTSLMLRVDLDCIVFELYVPIFLFRTE